MKLNVLIYVLAIAVVGLYYAIYMDNKSRTASEPEIDTIGIVSWQYARICLAPDAKLITMDGVHKISDNDCIVVKKSPDHPGQFEILSKSQSTTTVELVRPGEEKECPIWAQSYISGKCDSRTLDIRKGY